MDLIWILRESVLPSVFMFIGILLLWANQGRKDY